jgi:glycosyltransferase involved in cell wall biosynthesis
MLLSIGLIVKNEEKYLDECLSALTPLREKIGAEIIIVDTGSEDRTVEISKKYTDKVFTFKWCGDFSAARNETLKYAEGEWYLYFDADEILQNPDSIIRFFTSREYLRYSSASYIKRNFTMNDLSCYSDQNTVRLVRRVPKLHFEGIIHEYITPINAPTKRLDALFNHYGYLYTDEADKRAKAERNVELLEKQLRISPSAYTYLQLAESLRGIDCERALNAAVRGLEMSDKADMTSQLLYKVTASMHHNLGRLDLAASVIDEYFSIAERNKFIDMEMYSLAGFVLFDMKSYELCIQYFEAYHSLYEDYRSGGAAVAGYTVSGISPFEYRSAAYTAVSACINIGADENGADWLARLPLSSFGGDEQDLPLRVMLEENYDIVFKTDRLFASYKQCGAKVRGIILDSVQNRETALRLKKSEQL